MFFSGVLDRFAPAHLAAEQTRLQALIGERPILSALAHIGAITLGIATGLPGMVVLIMAGGMLFGVVTGALLNIVGVTIGALVLFLASRRAFGDHGDDNKAPGLVSRLRDGYLAQPVSYTFFLRLVPFFPFGGVTVALAWLRCPLWLFVTATAIGGFAMTGIETWLGASLAKNIGTNKAIGTDLLHDPQVLWPMIGLVLLALVPIAVNKLRAPK
ncbi:MAG: VTT domain-containing protein [Rudaea sp.]|uniref:TVP38/TMEM64 family protein n=1 Tax=Rudaea sp. TaxID=2136325 RepID=UPI0039E2233D